MYISTKKNHPVIKLHVFQRNGKPEAGKPEARSQKPEARGKKPEAGAGSQRPEPEAGAISQTGSEIKKNLQRFVIIYAMDDYVILCDE